MVALPIANDIRVKAFGIRRGGSSKHPLYVCCEAPLVDLKRGSPERRANLAPRTDFRQSCRSRWPRSSSRKRKLTR